MIPVQLKNFKHLWVMCENCEKLNYKSLFLSRMNICEHCGYHLKMSSFERIEVLLDHDTWDPMYEDMTSLDPIEWDSEEDPNYEIEWDPEKDPIEWDPEEDPIEWDPEEDPIEWDPEETLNSEKDPIEWDPEETLNSEKDPIEWDPEKDSNYEIEWDSEETLNSKEAPDLKEEPYLEEYSYKDRIDSYQRETGLTEAVQTGCVLLGGARMQEGSLSLMQMAKISSALYDYQSNKKLLYISILTSPTTGGVTASFGMLGDIIIAEPNAYIAFAGKRVIEQTLNIIVPEGSQEAEHLFEKGLLDLIVPRNLLKNVLSELLKLHAFFPLSIK
ncbi:hypothetical protein OROGR_033672 [Orobanche gracilis]